MSPNEVITDVGTTLGILIKKSSGEASCIQREEKLPQATIPKRAKVIGFVQVLEYLEAIFAVIIKTKENEVNGDITGEVEL